MTPGDNDLVAEGCVLLPYPVNSVTCATTPGNLLNFFQPSGLEKSSRPLVHLQCHAFHIS